jgi:putative phage-type endonuclease
MTSVREIVNDLIDKYGKDDQRTLAWHTKRNELLTASEIYKGINGATSAMNRELILSKLVARQNTSNATPRALLWGTRFEPIAKDIYKRLNPEINEIVDTTCVNHPTVAFLGASPDGIIISDNDDRHGNLVEFKCPISRDFDDNSEIPNSYYHQMQLQLECTRLETCEYIEMKFLDHSYTDWIDSKSNYKSIFAYHLDDSNRVVYRDIDSIDGVSEWKRKELGEDEENWKIVFWSLSKYRSQVVKHDTSWLATNLPSLTKIWDQVLEHRKNNTLPDAPASTSLLL